MKCGKVMCILMALTVLFCLSACGDQSAKYDSVMSKLDVANAGGRLIAAYNTTTNTYTTNFVPEEICAQTPEEVGYLLKLHLNADVTAKPYSHSIVSGDHYYLELVECSSGTVLAAKEFLPYFPETVESGYRAAPKSEDVTQWIAHVYPQWPSGQGPTHDFCDATCETPKTCLVCGLTEGDTGCHTLEEKTCTVCKKKFNNEWEGHSVQWSYDSHDTSVPMEGTCTGCGISLTEAWNGELIAADLIEGTHQLDYYMKDKEVQEGGTSVSIEVGRDGTMVIHTPQGDHSFTWEYSTTDIGSRNPDYYKVHYDAVSASGEKISMLYIHNSEIDISLMLRYDTYVIYFK